MADKTEIDYKEIVFKCALIVGGVLVLRALDIISFTFTI